MSIPISQFIPPTLSSLGSLHLFSTSVSLFPLCKKMFISIMFLDSTYNIWFFFSFCMTVSRSICISAKGTVLFLFMTEWYSIVHVYHVIFIHSSVDGHLGCSHVLAIVSSAAMNAGVLVSICFFLKSLLNFSQYCFCFMFWFFGHETYGVLVPWPLMESACTPCVGRRSLNHWTAREVPIFLNYGFLWIYA